MAEDKRKMIVNELKSIREIEKVNQQPFKVVAYTKVIKELENFTKPIYKIEDLADVKGIGKGIREKIIEIIDKGQTSKTEESDMVQQDAMSTFLKIMAVGPVKAKNLVKTHGITSIEQLREHQELLNDKQRIGLKYFEDFNTRIPRKEMEKHKTFIEKYIDSNLVFEITGSFRRNMSTSGDIDVLITGPDPTALKSFINVLKQKNYLVDDFAFGDKKYNGVCRLPRHKRYRRIDIMYTDEKQFPFALLYFTGSQEFNIQMRNRALELGYSLNEYGLKPIKKEELQYEFKTELDVFKFLKIQYVEPSKRKANALIILA